MLEYLVNINVANPTLKGIFIVAEILLTGFTLYWLWEVGFNLFSLFGKSTFKSSQDRTEASIDYTANVITSRKSLVEIGSDSQKNPSFET